MKHATFTWGWIFNKPKFRGTIRLVEDSNSTQGKQKAKYEKRGFPLTVGYKKGGDIICIPQ